MLHVIIGRRNYTYKRLSYGLPVPGVTFVKAPYVPLGWLKGSSEFLRNTYCFTPGVRGHLAHLWNGVCLNRLPWVTSFERELPKYGGGREDATVRLGLRRLADRGCRRILALTEAARRFLEVRLGESGCRDVARKVTVFRGALEVNEERVARHARFLQEERETFRIILVGNEFFRKGGPALVSAFARLRGRYDHAQLTVVSSLAYG